MSLPRVNLNAAHIFHNAQLISRRFKKQGVDITPVIKVCLGHPDIAQLLLQAGATQLADSRIENIERMRAAGITCSMMLIRSPMLSQAARVVAHCNVSLNTELSVIKQLAEAASAQHKRHGIILMVELGDLREGVLRHHIDSLVAQVLALASIDLVGIGANLACRFGVAPSSQNMQALSGIANDIEQKHGVRLAVISGGNSANTNWLESKTGASRVNHLRIGEAIFTGRETLAQRQIVGAKTNAITLTAEVIEANTKPSLPWGARGVNAFGERPVVKDRGLVKQAIVAIGRQDIDPQGLLPPVGITIVAASSDHLVLEVAGTALKVGSLVQFNLTYSGILSAMSAGFIEQIVHAR